MLIDSIGILYQCCHVWKGGGGAGLPVLTGRTAIIDCKRGGTSLDMNDHRFRSTFIVSPILATVD